MRKPKLIDGEIALSKTISYQALDGSWKHPKSIEDYSLLERTWHAWWVLTGKARAFRYYQDEPTARWFLPRALSAEKGEG